MTCGSASGASIQRSREVDRAARFLGSPAFALPSLEALRAAGHEIALVVTQPDRPAGRGQKPTPPPVAAYAREHGLPLWQTSSLRGDARPRRGCASVGADAMALAAFAALVPDEHAGADTGRHSERAPVAAAALARRGADPVGPARGRYGDGRQHHSAGRGAGRRADSAPGARADRARGRLRVARAAPGGLGARLLVRALARAARAACRRTRRGRRTAAASSARTRASTGRSPAEAIWNQVRAYRGWPRRSRRFDGAPAQSAARLARWTVRRR